MREQFDVPEVPIIDMETGYPINIPLGRVVPPGWQENYPDEYARIIELRKSEGVVIDDDELVSSADFVSAPPTKTPKTSFRPKPRRRK